MNTHDAIQFVRGFEYQVYKAKRLLASSRRIAIALLLQDVSVDNIFPSIGCDGIYIRGRQHTAEDFIDAVVGPLYRLGCQWESVNFCETSGDLDIIGRLEGIQITAYIHQPSDCYLNSEEVYEAEIKLYHRFDCNERK